MSEAGWPTPEHPTHAPLPRVEDMPVAEQGYDRDSVRAAFEAFYRHAAQLDATLRMLEAMELFQRQAEELRTDLRALRSSSWGEPAQPWTPTYGYRADTYERARIPPAVWRYVVEVVFLIGVAVALALAKVQASVIIGVMAAAWLIVAAAEWVAGRERVWTGRPTPQPVVEQPPAPVVTPRPELPGDTEEVGWTAFEEAQEPSDAMTIVGSLPEEEEQAPEPAEPASVIDVVAVGEAEVEPEHPPVEAPELLDEAQPATEEPQLEAEQAEPEPEEPAPEESAAAGSETPEEEAEPEQAAEPEAVAEAAPEPSAAVEQSHRRRWWRRRARSEPEAPPAPTEPPRHVRVLPHGEAPAEATGGWERGFESDGDAPSPPVETADDPEPLEPRSRG